MSRTYKIPLLTRPYIQEDVIIVGNRGAFSALQCICQNTFDRIRQCSVARIRDFELGEVSSCGAPMYTPSVHSVLSYAAVADDLLNTFTISNS
jgi:hypothetical protein